jgi:hypothetical protein
MRFYRESIPTQLRAARARFKGRGIARAPESGRRSGQGGVQLGDLGLRKTFITAGASAGIGEGLFAGLFFGRAEKPKWGKGRLSVQAAIPDKSLGSVD